MLADLARSGLDADDARRMRLRPADPEELRALGLPAKEAYEIPYLGLDGRPTGFRRWRYTEDTREGLAAKTDLKPVRYVQEGDTLPELYLPPQADWQAVAGDPGRQLVITEGEKKAAACCRAGHPCVGLGGVYSFKSKKKRVPLLESFKQFAWKDRDVVVAYDSDAHENRMVVQARNELCAELLALGAVPRVADVPPTEAGAKQGLDDLIVADGREALAAVFDAAESYAASAALHELSAEVAYVRDPGIVVRLADGQKMRAADFTSHAYANRHYHEVVADARGNERLVKRQAAPAWLQWEKRYELRSMAYEPGQGQVTADGRYNCWPGWGCEPRRGSVGPWRRLLDRLFEGFPEERQWFERWCAVPLQRPGAKLFTTAVLWGVEQGTGKSLVGVTLGRIYGRNYTLIGDKQLEDPRNEWAQHKQFVLGDDVTGKDQRKHADRLKSMITQEEIRIDPKYIPSFTVRDVINYLFTSNHPDAFFLEDLDRRYFVHEVRCPPMPPEQVAEYMAWLGGPGPSHLFRHLLDLDAGGRLPEDRAMDTAARRAMIDDGQSSLARWVRDLRDQPDAVLRVGDTVLRGDLWSSQDLLRVYDPDGRTGTTASAMSRECKRASLGLAYRGMPVPTPLGQRRLFVVRRPRDWKDAGAGALGRHYGETRAPAKRPPSRGRR